MFWLVRHNAHLHDGASVLVFRGTRNAQVMDRRLAGAGVGRGSLWRAAETAQTGGWRLLPAFGVGVLLNIASRLVPVGGSRAGQVERSGHEGGFSSARRLIDIHDGQAGRHSGERRPAQLPDVGGTVVREYTSTPTILLAGLAGAVMGGILPEMCLDQLSARRQRRMATALPDALDLMTLCLESGLTFERTLSRVGRTGDHGA